MASSTPIVKNKGIAKTDDLTDKETIKNFKPKEKPKLKHIRNFPYIKDDKGNGPAWLQDVHNKTIPWNTSSTENAVTGCPTWIFNIHVQIVIWL